MFARTRWSRNGANARRSRYRQPAQHALTGCVSPGRPSANLKDASLNPIKPFLVATTFAHHCPGPSSTATLARYRALPSGSSTIATTVSRGAVPACATHWTKTCGRSCGRRCSTTEMIRYQPLASPATQRPRVTTALSTEPEQVTRARPSHVHSLSCLEWTWLGRARGTCSGSVERAVVTRGRWVAGEASEWRGGARSPSDP